MKPRTDLSTRSNGIVKPPSSPVFSRRNSNPTGTLTFAAAGSQPLYKAPGSITVLWILFQVQSATTVQLFKNGEALSASYQLNAGAIVRYAGLLLLGNETLSLSVSGACVVTYEIAWVIEHNERLITTDTSISNPSTGSGGTVIAKIEDTSGNALNSNGAGALKVDGSAAVQPVSGTVAVSNFPATQPVSGSVAITGQPVAVSGFPGQYPIADTLGNQFLSDSAGNQRINPYGSTGAAKLIVATGAGGGAAISAQVPAGKKWKVLGGVVKLVTNATVASRTTNLNYSDAAQLVFIGSGYSSVTQAASLTRFYPFGPGIAQYTVFVQDVAQMTMITCVLPPLARVNANIIASNAADTITLWVNVIEYND